MHTFLTFDVLKGKGCILRAENMFKVKQWQFHKGKKSVRKKG